MRVLALCAYVMVACAAAEWAIYLHDPPASDLWVPVFGSIAAVCSVINAFFVEPL